jgi:orotidine-5'-phosphate decarboxylase
VAPFFAHGGGVIALCRTSNRGGDDFQSLDCDGRPLYVRVAETVASQWSSDGDVGLVVGATYPDELKVVRSVCGDIPILVPGIGFQGGDARQAVAAGAASDGRGLVVSSSRAVLYASSGEDFADAARAAAIEARDSMVAAETG